MKKLFTFNIFIKDTCLMSYVLNPIYKLRIANFNVLSTLNGVHSRLFPMMKPPPFFHLSFSNRSINPLIFSSLSTFFVPFTTLLTRSIYISLDFSSFYFALNEYMVNFVVIASHPAAPPFYILDQQHLFSETFFFFVLLLSYSSSSSISTS